jgi:hypothetical protein
VRVASPSTLGGRRNSGRESRELLICFWTLSNHLFARQTHSLISQGGTEMKFMANWSIDQDKWLPILKMWGSMTAEERADAGPGVSIIGRWHDMAGRRGVAILEATDLAALKAYMGQWNPNMDIDLAPVLDDEESAVVARRLTAEGDA